jgi:ribosomal protein L13
MLSKNHLGREHYKRLYIYKQGQLPYKENFQENQENWIKINI